MAELGAGEEVVDGFLVDLGEWEELHDVDAAVAAFEFGDEVGSGTAD